jgi:hypothetical protein
MAWPVYWSSGRCAASPLQGSLGWDSEVTFYSDGMSSADWYPGGVRPERGHQSPRSLFHSPFRVKAASNILRAFL